MEELINTLGQDVSADLEALSLITDEEQVILSRLANIEKKREECMKDIANVVNRDVSTLKLGDLIAMLNTRPQEQQKLAVLHDKLSTTITQMRRSNEQNKQLIESSLEMVQFDMNVIQAMKAAPETANYTRNAYASGDVMGVSSGRFDSKS